MSGREPRGIRRRHPLTDRENSRSRDRDSSRESSHQREVRCGCQYFQTDSLLPERQSLVGTRPPSRQSLQHQEVAYASHDMNGDHEYEPINPMASQKSPPPVMKVTDTEAKAPKKKGLSSRITYIDNDPNFIHIPLHGSDEDVQETYLQIPTDDKIVVSQDADADADIEDAQEEEEKEFDDEDLSAQEIQNRMEERFFAPTPTTTESRTDGEFNTSQIDSSALEDLPLKRESRKAGSAGFQQRLKSQAGRLRTKFRNFSKPKISLPDRPKFNLPERPKFKMPERPKINLPDRPKFNLPDRPKFNLPDRPKFNLPDRPKFNMPQRPKISMPNFNLGKPRTTSSLRRPLRDRNEYHSSAQSTYGGKKNIFDTLNFRTYPRFFNKKKRIAEENSRIKGRAMTPPPRMETDSIPSSPGSRKLPPTQSWMQKYRDIKFADDENRSNQSDKRSASLKAMSSFDDDAEDDIAEFRDQDFNGATSLDETKRKLKAISASSIQDSEKEQRSSGSSSDRHRKGVLEEIDSDEFFLRQKGLSREDVDVSRYLSLEIRDAFRSPQNALARMDTDPFEDEICDEEVDLKKLTSAIQETFNGSKHEEEDEEEFEPQPVVEPKRPSRSRSLKSKQSTQSRSSMDMGDDRENYNTYPPVRPSRKQSMQSTDKQSITTGDIKDLDLDNESFESNELDMDKRVLSIPLEQQSFITQSTNETWAQATQPPLPPKRRKSTKSLNKDSESMIDEVCPDDDWLDEVNAQLMVPGEITALQIETRAPIINIEQATYDSPPIAPLRKSRSRATSLADEDRTSRGCDSLISEARSMPVDEFPANRNGDDGNDMFGYATVEKPPIQSKTLERPQRQKKNKPSRPPPPNRFNKKKASTHMMNLKNQSINFFFTYPRRAMKSLNRDPPPVRPVRNYSTIGPSRPPRRTRVFKEPVYAGDNSIPFMDESEKETIDSSTPKIQQLVTEDEKPLKELIESDLTGEAKDLQRGDVILKMKGRPLPAPPRPPRKSKTEEQIQESMRVGEDDEVCDDFDDDEVVVSEKISIQITPEVGRSQTDIQIKEVQDELQQSIFETTEQVEKVETCTVKEVPLTGSEVSKEKTSPVKEVQEKVEKKEGPFTAFKEMISQKKREFFEPKKDKDTSPTKQESSEQKTKASREKSPIFKFIPLRSGSGQADTQVEETNASTQTDPLPEGYVVEEEQQTPMENQTEGTTFPQTIHTPQTKTESNVQSPPPIETVIEKRIVVAPDEDTEVSFLRAKKLQVSELDVEKINVSELQAKKISVSNIDGVSMELSEISSKAGNLVVNGVELPPEFLQSLRQATSSQEGQNSQATIQTDTQSPATSKETSDVPSLKKSLPDSTQHPPVVVYPSQTPIIIYPPHIDSPGQTSQQTISVHPAHITPFYGLGYDPAPIPRTRSPPRDLSAENTPGSLLQVVKKCEDDSSTGDETDNPCPRPILQGRELVRPTAAQLTQELMLIGRDSLGDIISQIITGLNRYFPEGEKRRDAQTAVCIALVLIAGLMLLGFGGGEDRTVHHHHWDFQFPPPH